MIPLSVFVVHPDPAIGARIARAVASAGHAPVLLGDGERAIDRFIQEPADALVIEHELPGRDGLATVESIRWAPGGRDVHVVLLAARETAPVPLHELARRVGALAALVGPAGPERVAEVLAGLERPAEPERNESTRVARLDEISGPLAKLRATTAQLERPALELDRRTDPGPPPDAITAGPWSDPTEPGRGRSGPVEPPSGERRHEAGSGVLPRPGAEPPTAPELRARPLHEAPLRADPAAVQEGREVREGADGAEGARARIAGRFEDTPFAVLLRRMADQHTSGALVCIAEGSMRETTGGDAPTKIVDFRNGLPVHVRSNLVDECLGRILVRRQRIDVATLEESVQRMKRGEGLQGEILVDMGVIAPLDLAEALADQARGKLFDLFGWTRGAYRLSRKLPPASGVPLEIGLPEIVYEGVCAAMSPALLRQELEPHLGRWVVPDLTQLARFARVRLVPEVRQVLSRVDGTQKVSDVLSLGTRPGAIAQLLYALECLGAVRFAEAARIPRGLVTVTERPPAEGSPPRAAPADRGQDASRVVAAPAAPPAPIDAEVDRLFEAERHFRRGNRALDRRRWEEALEAFEKAADLCPAQGEFLAYVGWARHCLAPEDRDERPVRELHRACELAPDLYVTYLFLARILSSANRRDEAARAYRRALELDPGCAEAREALGAR